MLSEVDKSAICVCCYNIANKNKELGLLDYFIETEDNKECRAFLVLSRGVILTAISEQESIVRNILDKNQEQSIRYSQPGTVTIIADDSEYIVNVGESCRVSASDAISHEDLLLSKSENFDVTITRRCDSIDPDMELLSGDIVTIMRRK